MIVVTFGTIFFPFDRAIDWLHLLLKEEVIVEPVVLQHGSTSASRLNHPLLTKVVSLTRDEMREAVKQSSLVISHAGQGSTRMLADMGACFVLLPRLKRYGEHIDDHQLLFARTIERFNICHCIELNQLAHYVRHRPAAYQGELFQAPLLVEHLIQQYSNRKLYIPNPKFQEVNT